MIDIVTILDKVSSSDKYDSTSTKHSQAKTKSMNEIKVGIPAVSLNVFNSFFLEGVP